jgi:hypothetical protein
VRRIAPPEWTDALGARVTCLQSSADHRAAVCTGCVITYGLILKPGHAEIGIARLLVLDRRIRFTST